MTILTDEMIEKAHKAFWNIDADKSWLDMMRAALEAILPDMVEALCKPLLEQAEHWRKDDVWECSGEAADTYEDAVNIIRSLTKENENGGD